MQPKVAGLTRACVYDRAGFGFSEPSTRAADIGNAVDDLHTLLKAASEAGPYVMVGNSFGGGIVEAYRWRYPADVTGLVLVEAMHEEENIRADAASEGKVSAAEAQIGAFGRHLRHRLREGVCGRFRDVRELHRRRRPKPAGAGCANRSEKPPDPGVLAHDHGRAKCVCS